VLKWADPAQVVPVNHKNLKSSVDQYPEHKEEETEYCHPCFMVDLEGKK
jgi:hypothetical protein